MVRRMHFVIIRLLTSFKDSFDSIRFDFIRFIRFIQFFMNSSLFGIESAPNFADNGSCRVGAPCSNVLVVARANLSSSGQKAAEPEGTSANRVEFATYSLS